MFWHTCCHAAMHKCITIHKDTHVDYICTPWTFKSSQSMDDYTHASCTWTNALCMHTCMHNHTHMHHICAIVPATHTAYAQTCTMYPLTNTTYADMSTYKRIPCICHVHVRICCPCRTTTGFCLCPHMHTPHVSTHALRIHAHMRV